MFAKRLLYLKQKVGAEATPFSDSEYDRMPKINTNTSKFADQFTEIDKQTAPFKRNRQMTQSQQHMKKGFGFLQSKTAPGSPREEALEQAKFQT